VRELVFDDTVAKIYLGPTLTARLRARFARSAGYAAGMPAGTTYEPVGVRDR